MQYVHMFGVMLILSISCLFVLLRLAVRSRGSEDHPGIGISSPRQLVSLFTSFLPGHVLINHNDLHSLILMRPNKSP
jgi:predicted secreted protein